MTDRCCGETYDAVIDVHQNLPAQDRWCGERQFDDEDICIFQIGVSRLCASMKARRLLVCLALVSLAALPMSRAEDVNLKTALRLAASDWASKILDDGDGDPKGTQLDRERLDEGICIDRLTCEGKAEYKDTANQVTDAGKAPGPELIGTCCCSFGPGVTPSRVYCEKRYMLGLLHPDCVTSATVIQAPALERLLLCV